jgi:hypothetical protein
MGDWERVHGITFPPTSPTHPHSLFLLTQLCFVLRHYLVSSRYGADGSKAQKDDLGDWGDDTAKALRDAGFGSAFQLPLFFVVFLCICCCISIHNVVLYTST